MDSQSDRLADSSRLISSNESSREKLLALLALQLQCAAWGMILGVCWLIGFRKWHGDMIVADNNGPYDLLIGSQLTFLLVVIVVSVTYILIPDKKPGTPIAPPGRTGLRLCSFLCVIAICLLIWATGGVHSAFTPFFVMTFTLTLERITETKSKWGALLFFVVPIMLVCLIQYFEPGGLIDPARFAEFAAKPFHYWTTLFGVALSMFVPTLGAQLEEYLDKRARAKTI